MTRDAIVTVGAMVAAELYGVSCPVVLASESDWEVVRNARAVALRAEVPKATLRVLDAVL